MIRKTDSLAASLYEMKPWTKKVAPHIVAGLVAASLAAMAGLAIPQALQYIVNITLGVDGDHVDLWIGVVAVSLLGIVEAALIVARRRLVIQPGTALESDLRVALYATLSDAPSSVRAQYSGGQLLSRCIGDVRRFRRWLVFGLTQTSVNVMTIAVGLGLIVWIEPVLGAIYVAAAVPAVIISVRARARYARLSRQAQDQVGELGATIEQSVHGLRVLKSFGYERRALEAYLAQAEVLRGLELGKASQRSVIGLSTTALPDGVLAVLLLVGLQRVSAGSMSVGALLAVFATTAIVAGPLERLSEQFAVTMEAKTAAARFVELLQLENPLTDPSLPVSIPSGGGRVTFTGVRFAYDDSADVLDEINLTIEPGQTLALVGPTGSGKTALGQLIPRLWDVTAGSVSIDGVDVRDFRRHDVRALVSIAFETPMLFSATVRENIALGRPDADDDDLWDALGIAQAHFVEALPRGLDTRIGEEGMSLSGGQRQRLSLARAIVVRPRVLVLDDPFSALDVRTEAAVVAGLRSQLRHTTTLLIASRLSTVRLADRVAVVEAGRISAIGTHEELARTSAVYRSVMVGADGVHEEPVGA